MPVLLRAPAPSCRPALGGVVALRSRDRLHLVLGFAAGVMLGLVAFDLLPELFDLSDAVVPGRAGRRWWRSRPASCCCTSSSARSRCTARTRASTSRTSHHHPDVGLASAVALAAHSFLDGVGIGLAFQVEQHGRVRRARWP